MSDTEQEKPPARLSISEEKLKLILADFKLELVEEFAKYASRQQLETLQKRMEDALTLVSGRLHDLELWRSAREAANRERRQISVRQLAWAAVIASVISAVIGLFFAR